MAANTSTYIVGIHHESGQQLRCDVFVDKIEKIRVKTTTRKIAVGCREV